MRRDEAQRKCVGSKISRGSRKKREEREEYGGQEEMASTKLGKTSLS
jgi:hypothetical protein